MCLGFSCLPLCAGSSLPIPSFTSVKSSHHALSGVILRVVKHRVSVPEILVIMHNLLYLYHIQKISVTM